MKETVRKSVVLAISGSDSLHIGGGTNRVIGTHQRMMNAAGVAYLHAHPFRILERNSVRPSRLWGVAVDAQFQGVYASESVCGLIARYPSGIHEIHIHQLMHTHIDEVERLCRMMSGVKIRVFLHDFQLVCVNPNLLRNDESFCGASTPCPEKCRDCGYWEVTRRRTALYRGFLREFADQIEFIAPSDSTRNLFGCAYPECLERTAVVPHQTLRGAYAGMMRLAEADERLRVAFVGGAFRIKGWDEYLAAVSKAQSKGVNVEFMLLGSAKATPANMTYIPVSIVNDPEAMLKTLREEKVDCAVLWSLCPETYSYTYFECLAANAFVLTNGKSGNICGQVGARKNGLVLKDGEALAEALSDPDGLRAEINRFREARATGPMTLEDSDWILKALVSPQKPCDGGGRRAYKHRGRSFLYRMKWGVKQN